MDVTIRRALGAALTAAALALPIPPASAAEPPVGAACAMRGVHWDTIDPAAWHVVVAGGPVVAPGSTVTLRCSIHVGNTTHSGQAAATVTGDPTPSVGVVAPAAVSYPYDVYSVYALCTRVAVDETTWYWDGAAWTANADASCPRMRSTDECWQLWQCLIPDVGPLPPEVQPYADYVGCVLTWGFVECGGGLDGVVCPVLRTLGPGVPGVVEIREDGDVVVAGELFWDCPPYQVYDAT